MTETVQNKILVPQEHSMGCAVACVASLLQISYQDALKSFSNREHAWTRGFYCRDIVEALQKSGLKYGYTKFEPLLHVGLLFKVGTIAFVGPCEKYPSGHFLLRAATGWMNPWKNFPLMIPIESGIVENLPGEPTYIVHPV